MRRVLLLDLSIDSVHPQRERYRFRAMKRLKSKRFLWCTHIGGLEGRGRVAEGEVVAGEVSVLQCGRGKGGRYCRGVCGRWGEYLELRIIFCIGGGEESGV
jgi:hypothetical protein